MHTKKANLYIDGNLVASKSNCAYLFKHSDNKLFIGGYVDSWDQDSFTGVMDEVRIYNRVLSEAEISELYSRDSLINIHQTHAWFDPYSSNPAETFINIPYSINEDNCSTDETIIDSKGIVVPSPDIIRIYSNGIHSITWEGFYDSGSGLVQVNQAKNPYTITLNLKNSAGTVISQDSVQIWVGRPVVLVHGYASDPDGCWKTMAEKLGDKFYVYKSDYAYTNVGDVATGSINKYGKQLYNEIMTQPFMRNYHCKIDIVAHSMGGLVTRKAFQKGLKGSVGKFIMLGTPNHGSELFLAHNLPFLCSSLVDLQLIGINIGQNCWLDKKALGQASIDMTPDSAFLKGLGYDGDGYFTIAGTNPGLILSMILPTGTILLTYDLLTGLKNDGFVREKSVFLPDSTYSRFACNHFELHNKDGVINKVKHILRPEVFHASVEKQSMVELLADNTTSGMDSEGSSFTGFIAPGATVEHAVTITASDNVTFLFAASADNAIFTVRSPGGMTYDNTSVEYYSEANVKAFAIASPEDGQWTLTVAIPSSVTETVEYSILTLLKTGIRLYAAMPSQSFDAGEQPLLQAVLNNGDTPITGATVQVVIAKADNTTETVTLYDDGNHGDNGSADGIYGVVYAGAGEQGLYELVFKASGTIDGKAFSREAASHFWIQQYNDLSVSADDITFSNDHPADNETVTISATIHNEGIGDADNASILIYDGNPMEDRLIKKVNTAITAGAAVNVDASWKIDNATHEIYVQIDPFGAMQERDYTNNMAFKPIGPDTPITSTTTSIETTTTSVSSSTTSSTTTSVLPSTTTSVASSTTTTQPLTTTSVSSTTTLPTTTSSVATTSTTQLTTTTSAPSTTTSQPTSTTTQQTTTSTTITTSSTSSSSSSTSTSSTTTSIPCTVKLTPGTISKLFSRIMPYTWFVIHDNENAAFTKNTTINWGTTSLETLFKMALGGKTIIAMVHIDALSLDAGGTYDVTVGGCTGKLKVK